jgi:hypothetical protein
MSHRPEPPPSKFLVLLGVTKSSVTTERESFNKRVLGLVEEKSRIEIEAGSIIIL